MSSLVWIFVLYKLLVPVIAYDELDPEKQIEVKFISRYKQFVSQDNVFQDICKLLTILSRTPCAKQLWPLLPEASYGLRVLPSPASVCVCVCVCVCVHQLSVCLDDNLSPAQATITKIGPEVQNTLVKIPFVFGLH